MLFTSCDCGVSRPIFRLLDGFDLGADQLDAVFIEHARFRQVHRQVEPRLTAYCGKQRIRTFAANHFLGERHAQRLHVGAVRQIGIGHDGGRIGIDQHHFIAVGSERLAGLRAGIVELAGLPDNDRSGTHDQDAVNVVAARHYRGP